jgi:hypothetical protein
MKFKNYKENTMVLDTIADYQKLYAELVANSNGNKLDLFHAVHNAIHPISSIYLNWDNSEPMLTDKHGRMYQTEMDKWSIGEFAKVKSLLAELREMNVPQFSNSGSHQTETEFLSYLEMCLVLRYRPLLANSWRVEQR